MGRGSVQPLELKRALGVALAAVALFGASWAALHLDAFTSFELVDTPVYESYGALMAEGEVPYRDFALEYPPGALPMFALPTLVDADHYREAFELVHGTVGGLLVAAIVVALARLGASRAKLGVAALFLGLTPLLLGPVVLTRFDLWPALLLGLALLALVYERPLLGLAVLGLAVSAKLYPFVVVPVALVHVARRYGRALAWRSALAFGAALAVVVGPFLALAPGGVLDALRRQTGRPLQIESLGASVLEFGDSIGLYAGTVETSFGSQNLAGGVADGVATLTTALQLLVVLAVWVLFVRIGPERGADPSVMLGAAATVVVAFVTLGKVFSPQFMIWLAALVPLALGRGPIRQREALSLGLVALASVATHLWFPRRYWDLVALEAGQVVTLFVRDLVVAALGVALAALWLRARDLGGVAERLAA